jgi:hypothetical protein
MDHEKLVVVVICEAAIGIGARRAHLKKKSNDLSLSLLSAPGDVFPYVDFEHPAFILCQLFVGSPPAVDLCVRVRCRYLSIYALSASIIPSTTLLVPLFSRRAAGTAAALARRLSCC